MNDKQSISKDYIFKKNDSGQLQLEGRFEDYYRDCENPWDQLSTGPMTEYYRKSRNRIAAYLRKYQIKTAVEVGCGLGISTRELSHMSGAKIQGIDISETAIEKAKKSYPDIEFEVGDICSPAGMNYQSDCIIFNQILWYILSDLSITIDNALKMLKPNGYLILCNAYPRVQNYGMDTIPGFQGAVDYFRRMHKSLKILNYEYHDDVNDPHIDGIIIFKKGQNNAN